MRALIIALVLAVAGGTAAAYPQFQLSKDQTCTGCHISPAGGALLNENGLNTAEAISQFGTNPELMYGAIPLPDWLQLGGDFRGMGGYLHAPQDYLWLFPMQADAYAAATKDKFSVHLTFGMRVAQEGNEAATAVWARELYGQWQSEPGSAFGVFVRAGQLMPVFGLRFVEHPFYTRRYGGTPLFSETLGGTVSWITPRAEIHASGWGVNPLYDPVRHDNGGALYGELRLTDRAQVGAGFMGEVRSADWYTLRGAATAKYYFAGPDVLLQGELQVINPHVDALAGGDGYGHTELATMLMGTWFGPSGIMLDVAYEHYDKNIRIGDLDRDRFDFNLHWFTTSHIELLLVNQLEFLQWGNGGPTGVLTMGQLHYRL
jgi:hypothetical protein